MRWSLQKQSVLLGIITHGEALVLLVLSNSTSERDADIQGDVFSPRELMDNVVSWIKTLRHIAISFLFIWVIMYCFIYFLKQTIYQRNSVPLANYIQWNIVPHVRNDFTSIHIKICIDKTIFNKERRSGSLVTDASKSS